MEASLLALFAAFLALAATAVVVFVWAVVASTASEPRSARHWLRLQLLRLRASRAAKTGERAHLWYGLVAFVITVGALGGAGVVIQQGGDSGSAISTGLAVTLILAIFFAALAVGMLIRAKHPLRKLEGHHKG
jgi:hypothetical protein